MLGDAQSVVAQPFSPRSRGPARLQHIVAFLRFNVCFPTGEWADVFDEFILSSGGERSLYVLNQHSYTILRSLSNRCKSHTST